MNSPDEDWWTLRSAEYVIGTLRGDDLDLFQRIHEHDPEVQAAVASWEARLLPLNASTAAIEPPEHVWAQIESAISNDSASSALDAKPADNQRLVDPGFDPSADPDSDITLLDKVHEQAGHKPQLVTVKQSESVWWPTIAMFATAASLIMGILLHQQGAFQKFTPSVTTAQAERFTSDGTSIVLDESGAPLWLVQTDQGAGFLRVTAIAPPEIPVGEDYQLWQVLPDEQGVASVGLLPDEAGQVVDYQATAFESGADAFAVSREPDGGSPEAVPSGPVLYQGLYQPTTQEQAAE